MKSALFLLLISINANLVYALDNRTCQEIYEAQGRLAGFSDELAMIDALKRNDAWSTTIIKKYEANLKKLPWRIDHTIDFLRIGFQEQIFCNPWPLRLNEIFQKIVSGEFSNALSREIERYQKEEITLAREPLLAHAHTALSTLRILIEKIKSPFPQEVSVRDPNLQDFTSNFFYFLSPNDGKIYVKPNYRKRNTANVIKFGVLEHYKEGYKLGNRTEWNLFNGTGGPKLAEGRRIIQFSVASDIVMAVDDVRQFYIFKPTEHKTPTQWTTNIGCPIPEKLFLPNGDDRWSFSVSVKIKPKERRTIEFMHDDDIVHYYEDADGKKIDFGFTATTYVLAQNGRRISYWDTGLSGYFGRAFTTPHRGNFVAENISAAGSTIMVIGTNAEGKKEIYTRMFDYEINGACPGEQHTYCATEPPFDGRILGLIEARRKLPLPGWQKMADIVLANGDFISTRISIELTGKGNAARLLKVAGARDGVIGYFQKMINDHTWEFLPARDANDGPFPSTMPLSSSASTDRDSAILQERNDMDYRGEILASNKSLRQKTQDIAEIELKDFHYYLGADEPSHIVITTKNGRQLSFNFHTNDAFTITTPNKRRESLIGNNDGEAKALVGTLIIPSFYLASRDPDVIAMVEQFSPFHLKMNAFDVLGNDKAVVIKSVEQFIDMDRNYSTSALPPLTIKFTRRAGAGYYERLVMMQKYLVTPSSGHEDIKNIIALNEELLRVLKNDKIDILSENRKNNLVLKSSNLIFGVWKRNFSFLDFSVTHSLRKFVYHQDLREFIAPSKTIYEIKKARKTVKRRIAVYKDIFADAAS